MVIFNAHESKWQNVSMLWLEDNHGVQYSIEPSGNGGLRITRMDTPRECPQQITILSDHAKAVHSYIL